MDEIVDILKFLEELYSKLERLKEISYNLKAENLICKREGCFALAVNRDRKADDGSWMCDKHCDKYNGI